MRDGGFMEVAVGAPERPVSIGASFAQSQTTPARVIIKSDWGGIRRRARRTHARLSAFGLLLDARESTIDVYPCTAYAGDVRRSRCRAPAAPGWN